MTLRPFSSIRPSDSIVATRRRPLAWASSLSLAIGILIADRRRLVLVAALGLMAMGLCLTSAAAASDHSGNPNTIASALANLKAGNQRFVSGASTHPHQTPEMLDTLAKEGQTPLAAVLACSDSRAPVEKLFDLGFGDLFVVRAAGAVPGTDQVGSLEYAVAHLGVPVILVLSHAKCGAVAAAVADAKEPDALGELLLKLSPVAAAVRNLDESKRLQTAVELSAVVFREQLPLVSPVLADALKEGRLAIVSGVLDIATGEVVINEGRWAKASGGGSDAPDASGGSHGSAPDASNGHGTSSDASGSSSSETSDSASGAPHDAAPKPGADSGGLTANP